MKEGQDLRRGKPAYTRGAAQLDGHRRLLCAIYLQAFQDLDFLVENLELLDKWAKFQGRKTVFGGSFSPEFLEYMGCSINKLRQLRQKQKNHPRAFFEDLDHPLHPLLNGQGLGFSVQPEQILDFMEVEIMKGQAVTLESRNQQKREKEKC
jgi:hypothetical protein